MVRNPLGRLAVTVLLAGAMSMVAPAPASATVFPVAIVAPSTLTISGSPPWVVPIGQPPAAPFACAPNPNPWTPSSVDVDFDGLGGTSIDAPGAYHLNPVDFTVGSTTFLVRIEGVNDTTGTVDPVTGTATQVVSLRARFMNCAGTQTHCLTHPVTVTLGGSWTGGMTPPGTAHLTGSGVVTTQFLCNALIASQLNGRIITLDLTLDA